MGKSLSSLVLFVQLLLMLLPGLGIASTTYIDHSLKPAANFSNHDQSWHQHTTMPTPCHQKQLCGKMCTTHTPKFLGLNQVSGIWPTASYGKDVIIGVIDSGIWPESESFNDQGMSEVPQRWKGKCEEGTAFSPASFCNNKLIGARSFSKGLQAAGLSVSTEYDFDSPRDYFGHGTHTSSTAAGNFVFGASYFGHAKVAATGVAPRAHLAIYKVLWEGAYSSENKAIDILAGMDEAVSDGVDVMSISLQTGNHAKPYFQDVIAIAALSAVERGIVVVCSAGNSGPKKSSVFNGAPWIMTVGAGTMDRYLATLELGNGLTFQGTTYFPDSISITDTLLYYGGNDSKKARCLDLDPKDVKEKIVLCDNNHDLDFKGQMNTASMAGAYGAIFLTESLFLDPGDYSIPGILLHASYATVYLKAYAMTGNSPLVKELRILLTTRGPAPQVADFSSRGPDPISPSILKPDILAPGVHVLGAVRPDKPSMIDRSDYNSRVLTDYDHVSGTSMAAPNIAGVVALVKAVHREWSPAAIRSAIMTTSTKTDNTHRLIQDQRILRTATPLDFGAGHVNPNRAMDPGLVYDMGSQDYIDFLCGLGYTAEQMMTVIRRSHWSCSENQTTDLNYPSFMVNIATQAIFPYVKHFKRTVTNVGDSTSTYRAVLEVPDGMTVRVEPDIIRFTSKYQKQDFVLRVEVEKYSTSKVTYGYLKWIDDNNHTVSSPIVVV